MIELRAHCTVVGDLGGIFHRSTYNQDLLFRFLPLRILQSHQCKLLILRTYSLFMCQYEDENQSFGTFSNLCMTNEPIFQCIIVLRAWFVRHRLYPERPKTFGFVFVLAHEQPITKAGLVANRLNMCEFMHFHFISFPFHSPFHCALV